MADNLGPASAQALGLTIESAHYMLGPRDLEHFVVGRRLMEILPELHWRCAAVEMGWDGGRAITVLTFKVECAEPLDRTLGLWIHAVFVNDSFTKFIGWLPDTIQVPYDGTTASVMRPRTVADCAWLQQASNADPLTTEAILREAQAKRVSSSPPDLGLTLAWLMLQPVMRQGGQREPTPTEYCRNAELRHQFNAARLALGMNESEIQSVIKDNPLEAGRIGLDAYRIYGSNESFSLDPWLHFSNILILFRGGVAIKIDSIGAGTGWRDGVHQSYLDMPKAEAPSQQFR